MYVGPSYLRSETEVAQLKPNEAILNQINLDPGGIAVTAQAQPELPVPGIIMNYSELIRLGRCPSLCCGPYHLKLYS